MQIPALTTSVSTALGANNRGGETVQRTAAENRDEGQSEESVQATGRSSSSEATQPVEQSTSETVSAQSTQVVTSTDQVLGTSLGLESGGLGQIIDTTA